MQALLATLLLSPLLFPAHTIVVHPGQSIQAAVDFAQPGDTIRVESGTYREAGVPCPDQTGDPPKVTCAVAITKDGITLIADTLGGKAVTIVDSAGLDNGIEVAKPNATSYGCQSGGNRSYRIRGSRIVGLTVRGFKGSGIVLECVDGWELAYDSTHDNYYYGLYPVGVGTGRMHHNVATGSHDTGFYVGQSHDVRVDHNVAYGNVSGYELENTARSLLDHNVAFNNTGGILEFELPHLAVLTDERNVISDNFVHHNNAPNTCPPGDEVCDVPPGTGILMVAGERNLTERNTVVGNKTYGIALADFCTAFMLPPKKCSKIGFDPDPNNTRIESNTALENGVDLIWTGIGTNDCWLDNRAKTIEPNPLPGC